MEQLVEMYRKSVPDYSPMIQRWAVRFEKADFTVIIPGHKRRKYIPTVVDSLLQAASYSGKKIEIVIVEQDRDPTFHELPFQVRYIYVPLKPNEQFNKSLCHNVAALTCRKSKRFIFHDIDTAVPIYFFRFLEENLHDKQARAMQCFNKQRLLLCDEKLTHEILTGQRHINTLSVYSSGIKQAVSGAKGGSICIDRDLFFEVGGFDTHFTGYSVEDAMFFNKVDMISKIGFCDSPQLELFHLWHEPAFNRTTKDCDWAYFKLYNELPEEQRRAFVKEQQGVFSSFVK